jgi:hypothetical protein
LAASAIFVMLIDGLACGAVAELEQLGVQPGSTVPGGGATIAVLAIVPDAAAGTVPVTV